MHIAFSCMLRGNCVLSTQSPLQMHATTHVYFNSPSSICRQVHDVLRTALRRHTETLLAARHSANAALKDSGHDRDEENVLENAAAPDVAVEVDGDGTAHGED